MSALLTSLLEAGVPNPSSPSEEDTEDHAYHRCLRLVVVNCKPAHRLLPSAVKRIQDSYFQSTGEPAPSLTISFAKSANTPSGSDVDFGYVQCHLPFYLEWWKIQLMAHTEFEAYLQPHPGVDSARQCRIDISNLGRLSDELKTKVKEVIQSRGGHVLSDFADEQGGKVPKWYIVTLTKMKDIERVCTEDTFRFNNRDVRILGPKTLMRRHALEMRMNCSEVESVGVIRRYVDGLVASLPAEDRQHAVSSVHKDPKSDGTICIIWPASLKVAEHLTKHWTFHQKNSHTEPPIFTYDINTRIHTKTIRNRAYGLEETSSLLSVVMQELYALKCELASIVGVKIGNLEHDSRVSQTTLAKVLSAVEHSQTQLAAIMQQGSINTSQDSRRVAEKSRAR